jgi:hypothetical protein
MVQSQPGQIVHKILSKKQNKTKKPSQNKGGGGRVGQGVGPDFNPSTSKKKKDIVVIGKAVGETSSCREGEGEDLIYTKCIL